MAGSSAANRPRSVQQINHRRVKPNAGLPCRGGHAPFALHTFAQDSRRIQRRASPADRQLLSQRVDDLGAQAAHLLGDKLAQDLLGIGGAGRWYCMVSMKSSFTPAR